MKKLIAFILSLSWLIMIGYPVMAQKNIRLAPPGFQSLVLMEPTGKQVNGFPEMKVIDEKSPLYTRVKNLSDSSFVDEFISICLYSGNFLKNNGLTHHVEPVYLALTQNEGGFGKKGFYLLENGNILDKTKTSYVDLVTSVPDQPADKLMSFTQLFPHELGHVILNDLVKSSGEDRPSKNLEMHYFNIITDYGTAFSEGFSEAIENAARLQEKNARIKVGIENDAEHLRSILANRVRGFTRDYLAFWRLDYYKYSMLLWYQKLENLKRYDVAMSGQVKFQNKTLKFNSPEKTILYRNAGLGQDTSRRRNLIQAMSTEGVVNAFFTRQLMDDYGDNFASDRFYRLFYHDTTQSTLPARKLFSNLQNQYLKNLYIFHKYVDISKETPPPLIAYMMGYIREFPSEEQKITSLFNELFGTESWESLPISPWIMVRNVDHSNWVMDQTGAFTLPDYNFNLNAAEIEDLLMIEGMSEEDAIKVIAWRKSNGYFTSVDDVKKITGLSLNGQELLDKNKFDQAHFNNMEFPARNFMNVIWSGLLWLIIRALVWYLAITGILLLFNRFGVTDLKFTAWRIVARLGYWLVFVTTGLAAAVFFHNPVVYVLALTGLLMLSVFLILRKKRNRLTNMMITTLLMCLIIILSL